MLCVIATIEVAAGRRDDLLALFRELVPKVRAEDGCIEYSPMIDVHGGLEAQSPPQDNSLVILEKWESIDALKAHLKTLHMAEYFRQAEDLRLSMNLRILQPA
ncbi:MAG: antibiotic biosynthesis monooxygenase [Planctomycetes bacterium]|nr:antibiotic biosynthesis monooxygenase [Planctomycetota bacterium]MCG2682294.1 antibiotic biosynthesis monooxygenase [Planctomycetales bacterium]